MNQALEVVPRKRSTLLKPMIEKLVEPCYQRHLMMSEYPYVRISHYSDYRVNNDDHYPSRNLGSAKVKSYRLKRSADLEMIQSDLGRDEGQMVIERAHMYGALRCARDYFLEDKELVQMSLDQTIFLLKHVEGVLCATAHYDEVEFEWWLQAHDNYQKIRWPRSTAILVYASVTLPNGDG